MSGGRPIIVALISDFIIEKRNKPEIFESLTDEFNRLLDDEKIKISFKDLNKKNTDNFKEEKNDFEKFIIKETVNLADPWQEIVILMSIAERRISKQLILQILDFAKDIVDEKKKNEKNEKEIETAINNLKLRSFVKFYQDDNSKDYTIVLHDEMNRLINEYWWNEHSDLLEQKDKLLQLVIEYYENELQDIDYSKKLNRFTSVYDKNYLPKNSKDITFSAEFLHYLLKKDFKIAVLFLEKQLELSVDSINYDYYDQILSVAEKFLINEKVNINNNNIILLEIPLRRIEFYNVMGKNKTSIDNNAFFIKKHKTILEKNKIYEARFIYLEAEAKLWLNETAKATEKFEEARKIFYKQDDVFWLTITDRYRGYLNFRKANFVDANILMQQSIKDFYYQYNSLLYKTRKNEKEKLYFDIRKLKLNRELKYSFTNISLFYAYMGKYNKGSRFIEIGLLLSLKKEDIETARLYRVIFEIYFNSLHTFQTKYYLFKGLNIIEKPTFQGIAIKGSFYNSRARYLAHKRQLLFILEIYRASQFKAISKKLLKDQYYAKELKEAKESVKEAIKILETKKERGDAHYTYAEILMIEGKWFSGESDDDNVIYQLTQAIENAQESNFKYLEIDALESIITAYYFAEKFDEVKEYTDSIEKYIKENPKGTNQYYPNLIARYKITMGDVEFDKGINFASIDTNKAINHFKIAFLYYIKAVSLKKTYNTERYFLLLSTFNHRIDDFISTMRKQGHRLYEISGYVDKLKKVWENHETKNKFDKMAEGSTLPLHGDEDRKTDIEGIENEIIQQLKRGNLKWSIILNSDIVSAYKYEFNKNKNKETYEKLILKYYQQAKWFHFSGDQYHGNEQLKMAEHLLKENSFPNTKLLGIIIKIAEHTFEYRKDYFNMFIESYISKELKITQEKYSVISDINLSEIEKKLINDATNLKMEIVKFEDKEIKEYKIILAETYYRIGELLLLKSDFESSTENFNNTLEIISNKKGSNKIIDIHRFLDTQQSLLVAYYFNYDFNKRSSDDFFKNEKVKKAEKEITDYEKKLLEKDTTKKEIIDYEKELLKKDTTKKEITDYEKELLKKDTTKEDAKNTNNVDVLMKYHINNGDVIFSDLFKIVITNKEEYEYHCVLRKGINKKKIRDMLLSYITAINYAASHNMNSYQMSLHIIQKRFELINDIDSLQTIRERILPAWNYQEKLRFKQEDVDNLIQYLDIKIQELFATQLNN